MEIKVYNVVIKTIAILVTVLASVILATIWLVSLPLMLIYELVVFLTEYLTGEHTNHNYAANSFIKYYKGVKYIYYQMINDYNFKL